MKRVAKVALAAGLATFILFVTLFALGLAAEPNSAQAQTVTRRQVTLLGSARRITTTTGDDIVNAGENLNVRGAYVFLDVTGVQTTPLITLSVQAIDPVSGDYVNVMAATSAVSSSATYLLYPGIGSAADGVTQIRSYPLPASWRVSVVHGDSDPITYSVSALLLP